MSHSKTDAERLSLDAGRRTEGSLALNLWDSMIEALDFQFGGKETMQHNNNLNPKKCLIIHSLKLITGGIILSLRTHNCPARKYVCLFLKTPIQ